MPDEYYVNSPVLKAFIAQVLDIVAAEPLPQIHLLGNDLGCIWRHSYDPHHGTVDDFRSGWANVECNDD